MTIDRKPMAVLLLGVTVIAGCTPNDITLGAAVRNNNEAQIIEPEPQYADEQTTDGSQVAGAQGRYLTDRVKKPKTIRTTNGESASGGRN
jgi:hypothetical protein